MYTVDVQYGKLLAQFEDDAAKSAANISQSPKDGVMLIDDDDDDDDDNDDRRKQVQAADSSAQLRQRKKSTKQKVRIQGDKSFSAKASSFFFIFHFFCSSFFVIPFLFLGYIDSQRKEIQSIGCR